ncbi:transcription-repair coupling factor [Entomobacter blattae]|uniref:Transcription-repair-coupling factor n=1 Tax=Entomobacter blattae TaxID=2762277 RepID=A0A7H1NUK7_9PROT|nr:transcription-repair coupling factor [Entomobacter blattae]QNT79467.1 Transcription-repair-coupling factor [Entomobacter blattae]
MATGTYATVWGVPDGYDALLLIQRLEEFKHQAGHLGPHGLIMHVLRDETRMMQLANRLEYFAPEVEILLFPPWDCLPYDRISPNASVMAERAATLCRLLEGATQPRIVLTTVNALVQRVPHRSFYEGQGITLTKGESLDQAFLTELLIANGYRRVDTVMEPGEFAARGNIFDLFPASAGDPVRIDLFGDEIESLRSFDPVSQRSVAQVESFALHPVSELSLDKESISRFRSRWRDQFGPLATEDPLYKHISEGYTHLGMEHYLPLFHEQMGTLFDYVAHSAISFDHQVEEVLNLRLEMIEDHYQARRMPPALGELPYRALPSHLLYLDREGWEANLARHAVVMFSPFAQPEGVIGVEAGGRQGMVFAQPSAARSSEKTAGPFGVFAQQVEQWQKAGKRVFVTAWSRGSRERIAALLREHKISRAQYENWQEAKQGPDDAVGLITVGLERGFIGDKKGCPYVFVSEQDLLGERVIRPRQRQRKNSDFIAQASEISEGDLVVHQDYGIGRYEGLRTIEVGSAPHDCLCLMYEGEEKLFLPVENIELLSRFGSEQSGVALDRLGSSSWQGRKAKMKQRIRDMAAELIQTAALRATHEAPVVQPPEGMWDEFCARFPFVETDDQQRAIADVILDLSQGRPMDRLICGDVGFGKTEVALRAAFVVAMTGAQVAVVVPTTLLSRQHYRTFQARFAGFPIKIAQLSRLVTAKEASQVRKELAEGNINIVIGTHALLAKSVKFSALELLIIDEEQHFGVTHKEKLKALCENVHVLTLSATPLPRTLQLALTGVREMSLIATPPTDRLAVRTFIMPFDSMIISEALQRERLRGGQVFCVVPRIDDMEPIAKKLHTIQPDARIVQAHGRLSPVDLEQVMTEFSDGKYDILLSTNIVESGLDMPSVNTLVVYRADLFGLGQLYQLRGRVGRGKLRGYAYLTWPAGQRLSAASEKRLEIMQTLDSLGAGFTLASHDLDMRGAGNLLGDEQSGHIREVGIELYQQMLEDAVSELKSSSESRQDQREWTPNINLGLPVLIPETYVKDLPVRLGLYRRIGALHEDADIEAMRAELLDRFGDIPSETENLLQIVELKRLCRLSGVEKLEAGPKGIVVQFHQNDFSNLEGLLAWIAKNKSGVIRLRPDQKLAYSREIVFAERIEQARKLLKILEKIGAQKN